MQEPRWPLHDCLPRCHHKATSGLCVSPTQVHTCLCTHTRGGWAPVRSVSPSPGRARPRVTASVAFGVSLQLGTWDITRRRQRPLGTNPPARQGQGLGLLQNGWNWTQEPKPRAALPGSLGQTLEATRSSENCLFFPESRWFWLNCPRGVWARAPATLRWKRVFNELKIPRTEDGAWRWARPPSQSGPKAGKSSHPSSPEDERSWLGLRLATPGSRGPGSARTALAGLGGGSAITPPRHRHHPPAAPFGAEALERSLSPGACGCCPEQHRHKRDGVKRRRGPRPGRGAN